MTYSPNKILGNKIENRQISRFWQMLFVCIGLTFYSCSSLTKIGIEVAVQPEYPIADDIQSLALLNRSLTGQFTNSASDSLEKFLIKNKMVLDSMIQDSIAADTLIQVAAKALFESGRFDVVVPKAMNIVRTDNQIVGAPLNTVFIQKMCNDFNVNAVLVLESFAEQIRTEYNESILWGSKAYEAATDITYMTEWRLYRPDENKPVVRFQLGDSIFWKDVNISLEDLYSRMPKTKSALIGGGIAAGLKIAEYISPNWITQDRYYYVTGNKEIDAAIPLIKNNKWDDATAIWSKFATVKSKVIRSKVEFNLALAAEMDDDLDLAIEWGLKSYKTRYTKAIEFYLKTLDNKKKTQPKEHKKRY